MNTLQFFSRVVMLAGLILITAACVQTSLPQASQTPTPVPATLQPTPSPTPWGGASANLGSLSTNCSAGSALKKISSDFGPAAGASPVWAGAGNFGTLHNTPVLVWSPEDAWLYHNQYGWIHKFLWVVETSYRGLVTIHGANLSDGSPLYPEADGQAASNTPTSLILDTRVPNLANRNNQLTQFPGDLIIPKAGCYYLEANWSGGRWRITFAAGEVSS